MLRAALLALDRLRYLDPRRLWRCAPEPGPLSFGGLRLDEAENWSMRFLPSRLAVLRMAQAHQWVRESGPNRGEAVRAILASVGLPEGYPWCAAFVAYCGRAILREHWPLPRDARCQALYEAALRLDMVRKEPEPGAIFLLWGQTLGRFRHTGFVIEPSGQDTSSWATIEGNTNPQGSSEGDGVYRRVRSFASEDRFIVWYHEQGGTQ